MGEWEVVVVGLEALCGGGYVPRGGHVKKPYMKVRMMPHLVSAKSGMFLWQNYGNRKVVRKVQAEQQVVNTKCQECRSSSPPSALPVYNASFQRHLNSADSRH